MEDVQPDAYDLIDTHGRAAVGEGLSRAMKATQAADSKGEARWIKRPSDCRTSRLVTRLTAAGVQYERV